MLYDGLGLAILLCVAGCGFVRDEVLDGPDRLVAIDTSEDMSLCRSMAQRESASAMASRVLLFFRQARTPNTSYLSPSASGDEAPIRSVSEFYYISRQANEWDVRTPVSLSGPSNEFEYQQEKRRLQLPEFSRVFAYLK
jgi:hypothetical protein